MAANKACICRRPSLAKRPKPKNKLTPEERQEIIEVAKKEEFENLPPSQIVPKLADQSIYIASESSFYRVLRMESMQYHRGRGKRPERKLLESYLATKSNQVWTWNIRWLPGPIKVAYFKLYMILDIFSRMPVGWEYDGRDFGLINLVSLFMSACKKSHLKTALSGASP